MVVFELGTMSPIREAPGRFGSGAVSAVTASVTSGMDPPRGVEGGLPTQILVVSPPRSATAQFSCAVALDSAERLLHQRTQVVPHRQGARGQQLRVEAHRQVFDGVDVELRRGRS